MTLDFGIVKRTVVRHESSLLWHVYDFIVQLRWELAMDASYYYKMTYTENEYVITRTVIKRITGL